MSTKAEAIQKGAEALVESAGIAGEMCGLPRDTAKVVMLERALAIAWTDVSMWDGGLGSNTTPERQLATTQTATRQLGTEIAVQHIARRGHVPARSTRN